MTKHFTILSMVLGVAVADVTSWYFNSQADRHPSALEKPFIMQIKNLSLHTSSRIKVLENFYLKATFDGKNFAEFGRDQNWVLQQGETMDLNLKLVVDQNWMHSDQLQFKLELLRKPDGIHGLFGVEDIIVRCAQISKEISQYNRSYQCTLPGESAPFLTYRLGKDDELSVANK